VAATILARFLMRKNSGFTFALAGFALLTCGDAAIKSMAGMWPGTAIAALRFSLAVPLLACFVIATQGTGALRISRPWIQFGRGMSLAASACLFFLSLFLMPLAEATAIIFASPVVTALLSALFLREPLDGKAWLSTVAALAGVALVLRPNLAELGIVAFLPLAAAVFFSLLMIFNRLAAGTGSATALQLAVAAVAAPIMIATAFAAHQSGAAQFQIDWPEASVMLRCAMVAVSASVAHWLIYQGTVRSSAADAAQAVYVQLPVALVLDALAFRNFPDLMALSGSLLIVCAGLVMWVNRRQMPTVGAEA
jgi:drug/metabolite transporter (DMT)-like permease